MKKETKKWSVYLNNILSQDLYTAVILMNYLKEVGEHRLYVPVLEIIESDGFDEMFIVSRN